MDALLVGTVRRLEGILGPRTPRPAVGLGVSWGAPQWTAPVSELRMYPPTYEEFLDEKLRRLRLTGATRNILLRIARETGRRDFDVLLALTGYAADRYIFLRSSPPPSPPAKNPPPKATAPTQLPRKAPTAAFALSRSPTSPPPPSSQRL